MRCSPSGIACIPFDSGQVAHSPYSLNQPRIRAPFIASLSHAIGVPGERSLLAGVRMSGFAANSIRLFPPKNTFADFPSKTACQAFQP